MLSYGYGIAASVFNLVLQCQDKISAMLDEAMFQPSPLSKASLQVRFKKPMCMYPQPYLQE